MVEIKSSERTVSKGLSKNAVIHMVKHVQVLEGNKWVTQETIEEDMDRDKYELMIGDSVADWFNSAFDTGTFKRRFYTDPVTGKRMAEAINTCPNKKERNKETYTILRE